jgi:hypothetical protein
MYRMANPASNFANLASLTPSFLSGVYTVTYTPTVGVAPATITSSVQNAIQTFLTGPQVTTYEPMVAIVQAAQNALAVGTNLLLRTLLAASDGRVAYDSTKTNTFANYSAGTIGDNHNTRPEVMLAVLSSSGVGLSERFSSTTASSQKYQATRLGDSANGNLGTFRISMLNA